MRELTAIAERWRLAIGDFAHLSSCTKIQEGADQKLFSEGSKYFFQEGAFSGASSSPIRFASLHMSWPKTVDGSWLEGLFSSTNPENHLKKPETHRGFEKGLVGGGCQPTAPKIQQKCPPELCSPTFLGGIEIRGPEKRPESMAWEGFACANPLCPPTPFRDL